MRKDYDHATAARHAAGLIISSPLWFLLALPLFLSASVALARSVASGKKVYG